MDGTVDLSFGWVPNSYVKDVLQQPDGKMFVAGLFTNIAGQARSYIARFNTDETLDTTFNPTISNPFYSSSSVDALALQSDGKIILGGSFYTVNGQTRTYLARLNTNGTLDTSFNVSIAPNAFVAISSAALQLDGKIIIAGGFNSVAGQPRTNLARLNSNGTLDTDFNPQLQGSVAAIAIQTNNQILLGGTFTNIAQQGRTNLARLNENGALDLSFAPVPNGSVSDIAVQTDGRIVVIGSFTQMGTQICTRIGRLNPDGTLDDTFISSASSAPSDLAIQADGKILLGGSFTNLGGELRNYVGRLNNTDEATESLSVGSLGIIWLRGGSAPEALRVTFDGSSDGTNWDSLGSGQRIAGGWELLGDNLVTNTHIRARGFIQGNNSSWSVESFLGPLRFIQEPVSQTNIATALIAFRATAIGEGQLNYQWYKDDVPLTNGANIFQASTATLVLTNVLAADEGAYSVVVSNLSGSITSVVAHLTVVDPYIAIQPISKSTNTGQNVVLNVGALGTMPIVYQWRKEGVGIPNATTSSLMLSNIQSADVGSYDVVASNSHGAVTSTIATVTFPVTPDSLNPGANNNIFAIAVQADGKTLVGGSFTTFGSQTRSKIARLNLDGSLDTTFNPVANSDVFSIAVQPDGKILVGGWFNSLGGQPRNYIGRLYNDGTLDTTFNPNAAGGVTTPGVYSIVLQPDGKILVAGDFRSLVGLSRTNIARLNPDGSLDTSFTASANDLVYPVAVQPDGKILLGGNFTNLCGESRQHIGRLNADGTLDTDFNPGTDNLPLCFGIQRDGKIVVGGSFASLAGQPRGNLGRLNLDGTLDESYCVSADGPVRSIAFQADGKALIGGSFSLLAGQMRRFLVRFMEDGMLDLSFDANVSPYNVTSPAIYAVAIQKDGNVLIGGSFTAVGGQARNYFARLNNTGPALENLTIDGSSVRWFRNGTSCELSGASFDAVIDNTGWINLGSGTYSNQSWVLENLNLPESATIRARGRVLGGRYGASGWITESSEGPLGIGRQPLSRTNNWGTVASFTVEAGGTPSLGYQWFKDGTKLTNNTTISGVNFSTLVLSNVVNSNAGSYSVVVTNFSGAITSEVAVLTILNPFIRAQPTNKTVNAGATATFSVQAGGSPLNYQWYKDDIKLTNGGGVLNAQSATLSLTNVTSARGGDYSVVVSNSFSVVTSSVVQLTVISPFIDSHAQIFSNPFGFDYGGGAGQVIVIEGSTNLSNWISLATNTLGGGNNHFSDLNSTNIPNRFYRLRAP